MRLAFISTMHGSPWGGSEELWSQAAVQLKRRGHDVWASVGYWPHPSDKIVALPKHGIRLETHTSYQEGRARRAWDKLSLSGLRGYGHLKRFDPDLVVISQGHNGGGFEWARACRKAEIPYAILVHLNSDLGWFGEELGEALASYNGARRVFCVSRGNLDLLRLQLGEPQLNAEIVRNPYNVSTAPAPPWPDARVGLRLACVARIELAAKGQDLVLQVLARPEWRDRFVELNLFGAGPDELALRRICEMLQLNNVRFRGHVKGVREIWEQNHLLVLPSRREGLPLALVEAMWCGRPAVVTDVGGNAELCVDGETGFVAPGATVSSLGEALERAWDRRAEWHSLGGAARARVEAEIPKDPVALFCERLEDAAAGQTGSRVPQHDADHGMPDTVRNGAAG
jgi:glycosyltransferase involved in cell wall biosynthesis